MIDNYNSPILLIYKVAELSIYDIALCMILQSSFRCKYFQHNFVTFVRYRALIYLSVVCRPFCDAENRKSLEAVMQCGVEGTLIRLEN